VRSRTTSQSAARGGRPDEGPVDWLADNHRKGVSAVPAVTVHATPEGSRAWWDVPDEDVAGALLRAARLASPAVERSVQVHRWRFARPTVLHPDRWLVAQGLPPLVLAGDAFGGAKVEGAALSGAAAADAVRAVLGAGDGAAA
jgi:hypothetical protein